MLSPTSSLLGCEAGLLTKKPAFLDWLAYGAAFLAALFRNFVINQHAPQ